MLKPFLEKVKLNDRKEVILQAHLSFVFFGLKLLEFTLNQVCQYLILWS